MNHIYLHMEEMQNFMNSMRDILQMPSNNNTNNNHTSTQSSVNKKGNYSDAAVMSEIQRIVIASTHTTD